MLLKKSYNKTGRISRNLALRRIFYDFQDYYFSSRDDIFVVHHVIIIIIHESVNGRTN